MPACFLKKSDRILNRKDFLRIGAEGKRLRTEHFIVLYRKNDLGFCRLGITVSKKIGGAVKRNRVKRILREFFRLNREKFSISSDLVFIAGRGSYLLGYQEVRGELLNAFNRKGLLRPLQSGRG